MKWLLLLSIFAISCTKGTTTSIVHNYRCMHIKNLNFRPVDSAMYVAHGSYKITTTTFIDTAFSMDSTSIINYMHTHRVFPGVFLYAIADTAVYVDSNVNCTR